jgi:hypothetical protein
VVGCTGVDDPVKGGWCQHHGAVGGGKGGYVPTSSQARRGSHGVGPRRHELRWSRGRRGHAVWGHGEGRWRGSSVGGCSQESRRLRGRTGGTGGLARPHGDGGGPGVVDRWPALALALAPPAGGTSTRRAATPAFALARGRRGGGRRTGGGPDRRGVRAMAPGGRLTTWRSTVECRGWSGCLKRHGELKEKLIPHDMEGGKRHSPLDESLQVVVPGAEATKKVQHQGVVDDSLAEITKRVRHALHLAAVVVHGEFPLREQVELGVEVEHTSLPIPEELILENEPRLTGDVRPIRDDVLQYDDDGAVEPRDDHDVHLDP